MTDWDPRCPAHIIQDGEPLDCVLLAGHRLPHEAERTDGEWFEWDSFGSGRVAS